MNYQVYFCEDCEKNEALASSVRREMLTGNVMCFHKYIEVRYPEGSKKEIYKI